MSKLYNPELIPKEEIKRTFVGRHKLVEEIVSIIETQPEGAGVQHLVMVAPRGMGKTTMLLMLRFTVEDGELSKDWQPVQFPEESYDVFDLSDFWIKIAEYLAADTGDANLSAKITEIKSKFTKNEDLYEVAYALLKDWRRKNGKRLVLLIDNFDMILQQINSEQDAARLRKVLMNEDTVMLIGSAVTFFQEVRGYEHPLYNFFKIYNLEGFEDDLIEEFLRRRAKEEGITDFDRIMRENRVRIKTLAYFTDGNPRLVLMLFDVISNSKITDVEKALEILLDEVTPYFKSKIELLPPQQRKILDYIARMSFEKREGVTPNEISAEVRLAANQTSAQLKRLTEAAYIKPANVSGRSSFYVLSEPLVAIWYQMRFGRTAFQKRRWLIQVLKALYELEEMRGEQKRLRRAYQKALDSGETERAKEFILHQLYMAEAMPEFSGAKPHFEYFVSQSMVLKNDSTLKEELKNPDLLKKLSNELLDQLQTEGYINEKQCAKAKADSAAYDLSKKEYDSIAELLAGEKILEELTPENRAKQLQKVLEHFNLSIELNPKNFWALRARSDFYYSFGKYREAIFDVDKEIKVYKELSNEQKQDKLAESLAEAYVNKGNFLNNLGKFNEAIVELNKAINIFESLLENRKTEFAYILASACLNKGVSLAGLVELNEAIDEYDKAIEIFKKLIEKGKTELTSDCAVAHQNKGNSLAGLDKLNESIIEFDKAIKLLKPLVENNETELANSLANVYMNKGVSLRNLNKLNESIVEYDKAIEIRKSLIESGRTELANDLANTYVNKGVSLVGLGKLNEAISEYDKAAKFFDESKNKNQSWHIPINRAKALLNKSIALIKLKKLSQAGELIRDVVETFEEVKNDSLNSGIFRIILSAAEGEDYSNIRKLLQGEEMEKRFFPVLRAIDYLETGDADVIEKLSPEVRGIVEEAVRALRYSPEEEEILKPVKKAKKRKK